MEEFNLKVKAVKFNGENKEELRELIKQTNNYSLTINDKFHIEKRDDDGQLTKLIIIHKENLPLVLYTMGSNLYFSKVDNFNKDFEIL